MDGVIVENHQYHFQSWQELAAKNGISIDEEFYRNNMNGRTFMGIMQQVFDPNMTVEAAREKAMEKESIYRELYRPQLAPTSGLIPFLDEAKSAGVPMAVGTSAAVENVEFTLDGLNIGHYFDAVMDERAVTKGKPDPEIYQKCAAAIKLPNANCVVFEDAVSGIAAGKAAGSKVIALATSHKREELEAEMILDNFNGLTLTAVKSFLDS